MGWNIEVGKATRYGLDGSGIESSHGGKIFRTRADQAWDPKSLQYNVYRISLLDVERPGRGADHPTPSGVRLKGCRAIPLIPSSWAFKACSKVKLDFLYLYFYLYLY